MWSQVSPAGSMSPGPSLGEKAAAPGTGLARWVMAVWEGDLWEGSWFLPVPVFQMLILHCKSFVVNRIAEACWQLSAVHI